MLLRRDNILASQCLVGQALSERCACGLDETDSVTALAFVVAERVAERLFVEIAKQAQVERLDADVGSFQPAFEQRPEILDPVEAGTANYGSCSGSI